MDTHPAIANLRGNRAAQYLARDRIATAIAQWHKCLEAAQLSEALKQYAGGAALEDCQALHRTLNDVSTARSLIDDWQAIFSSALRDQPLSEMPFRHRVRGPIATIQLCAKGKAALSLCSLPRGAVLADQEGIIFSGRETCELVVEGRASGVRHRLSEASDTATLENEDAAWQAGDTIKSFSTSARSILHIEQSLLVLQVSRAPVSPQAAREFSLQTGRHVRSACGDERTSQKFMALGVLGVLGGGRAALEMANVARNASLDRDLRWEAVRQLLALEPASGMRLLAELRTRSDDPLCMSAAKLAAQLVASQPQLGQFLKEAA